ncbi:hypothetical protein Leryth_013965 [Lithospermum erythrorhizon]|nr:hypothetical protein Leryth_013965 [Lithospermum erythrorhizon]
MKMNILLTNMEEIKTNSIQALKEMDEDGDDAITLEEFMERTGLIWADERIKKKYRGVHQQKSGRWGAVIRDGIKTKSIWLGTYHTAEEAARAYDRASFRLKGTKASLNFPQTHVLSTNPDNNSPIIQHLFDSQGFLKSLWEEPLPDPGIESHNNLEVESEKLEDSPRKFMLIHT